MKRFADELAATRILGARDGYVSALLKVRGEIALVKSRGPIDPRHTRKLAERDRVLAPLLTLERIFAERHRECQAAYEKRRAELNATRNEATP